MPTIDQKAIQKIRRLFARKDRKSLFGDGELNVSDQRIRPFETNGAIVNKFFKKLRGGMAAGNKDTKVLGDPESKKEGRLNDMPKFTPFNCNFFKQTISATEQADKLLQKSSKDNRDSEEPRLTSDKTNPIYDKKRYKSYINSSFDQKFLNTFNTS